MSNKLIFTRQADEDLTKLEKDNSLSKHYKAVCKALGYLEVNPRHKSLNTHEFTSLSKQFGVKVFEAYANTPAAYRFFWIWEPNKDEITILAITPHP